MTATTEAYGWQGRTVVDSAGEKIGKIDSIYEDQQTGKPEWALVHTGLFGTKSHFVPLAGAAPQGEDVAVDVSKDQVREAPSVDAGDELSQDQERRLFDHYGVPYAQEGTVTAEGAPSAPEGGQPADRDHDAGAGTDQAMTRSEEEISVGTERREAGRARLRKYVVTEEVTQTVPVRREEVRVEREPITEANRDQALEGAEISEDEHEVVLHEEQPVVEKRAVPKERVRLDTDVVSEDREIAEQVRKERIETDAPEDRA